MKFRDPKNELFMVEEAYLELGKIRYYYHIAGDTEKQAWELVEHLARAEPKTSTFTVIKMGVEWAKRREEREILVDRAG